MQHLEGQPLLLALPHEVVLGLVQHRGEVLASDLQVVQLRCQHLLLWRHRPAAAK